MTSAEFLTRYERRFGGKPSYHGPAVRSSSLCPPRVDLLNECYFSAAICCGLRVGKSNRGTFQRIVMTCGNCWSSVK
jgi:hypothetical protein